MANFFVRKGELPPTRKRRQVEEMTDMGMFKAVCQAEERFRTNLSKTVKVYSRAELKAYAEANGEKVAPAAKCETKLVNKPLSPRFRGRTRRWPTV